jgi:hypothetical protein
MKDILNFLDILPSETLLNEIRKTSEKQGKYKSNHKYSLEQFGLSEERIRKDYKIVYDTFMGK